MINARGMIEALVRPKPANVLHRALAGEVFDVDVPTNKVQMSHASPYLGDQAIRTLLRRAGIPHFRTTRRVDGKDAKGQAYQHLTTVHVNQFKNDNHRERVADPEGYWNRKRNADELKRARRDRVELVRELTPLARDLLARLD